MAESGSITIDNQDYYYQQMRAAMVNGMKTLVTIIVDKIHIERDESWLKTLEERSHEYSESHNFIVTDFTRTGFGEEQELFIQGVNKKVKIYKGNIYLMQVTEWEKPFTVDMQNAITTASNITLQNV